ncbi:MAG: hypothetical protein RIS63_1321, partial [Bacteroidota bacterium]
IVLFGLYLLGIVFALGTAVILKLLIKSGKPGFHVMELPDYKTPRLYNVGLTVYEKVKIFIFDAGKIIVAISILLWALASYGPNSRENNLSKLRQKASYTAASQAQQQELESSLLLSQSYIGHFGKWMEPVIKPLGYDGKLALLYSAHLLQEKYL